MLGLLSNTSYLDLLERVASDWSLSAWQATAPAEDCAP